MKDPITLNGRDITIGGIVSEAKVLPTKKGTFYGRLTIEDFTDSFEITLFGKDFENYRKFFFIGYPLMIKGRFDISKFRQGELEFYVRSIQMLSDVRDEFIKKITIPILIDDVNEELIDQIKVVSKSNTGKVQLKIKVIDPKSQISMEMFSRSYRVALSNELISHLKKMDLKFKVN
jgi:DNA polymerase-3 subunit alpha